MVFSSVTFLWIFLPISLACSFLFKGKKSNPLLLILSLIFYAWGEPINVLIMIFSIVVNWLIGIELGKHKSKMLMAGAVVLNIGLLFVFKYLTLMMETLGLFIKEIHTIQISLPIGISFFTFQALSYVIDVYRGEVPPQKSLLNLALYISFFPQLIAGPIVRYQEISEQIEERTVSQEQLWEGIRRFIMGLGKKVIIANTCAIGADRLFALNYKEVTGLMAWTGALLYTLQIYYDFSGYSDMAIGLGSMFGFTFSENFKMPYLSCSIREFWQRWHISLGTWFREYVYIPLGGNRKGHKRATLNLLIVFLLTGIWHGAAWSFLLWGGYHGILRIAERTKWGEFLSKHRICGWVYTTLAVVFGWVLFRTEDATVAGHWMLRMIFPSRYISTYYVWPELIMPNVVYVGILGCMGLFLPSILNRFSWYRKLRGSILEDALLLLVLLTSMICIVSGTYNPFIYFKF